MQEFMEQPQNVTPRPSGQRGRLPIVSAVALGVLIVLIAVLLSHRTGLQLGGQPEPVVAATVQSVTCQGSTLGCGATPGLVGTVAPVTDQGITIQVTHAHMDALTTTILVQLSSDTVSAKMADIADGTFTDAQGQVLQFSTIGSLYHSLSDHETNAIYTLLPLRATQLLQPQQLTFTAHHITTNPMQLPGTNAGLFGTWRSTFTVNPTPGTQYQIQAEPVIQQGVGFSVDSVDIAPASAGKGDIPTYGGVRIMLTATNVPAATLLQSFTPWYPTTGPFTGSCPANGCPPRPGPTSAVLSLPGFSPGRVLNWISFVPGYDTESAPATVGPTHTVQIELIYPGSGTLTGTNGTVTISNFHLFTSTTPSPEDLQTTPAWQIPIPLHD